MRYRIQLEPGADFEKVCDDIDTIGFRVEQRQPLYNKLIIAGPSHLMNHLLIINHISSISAIKEIPLPA